MTQRRIVKSPFTKEERQGIFITREDSRKRRRNWLKDENTDETEYEFNYDLELIQKAVESETVYLPKGLKEKGEILEWLLNYDKENNNK